MAVYIANWGYFTLFMCDCYWAGGRHKIIGFLRGGGGSPNLP